MEVMYVWLTKWINKDAILKAFSDITTKAEDKDRVLIYFAGHGDTDDLPEGGEMGYLLPVDGNDENLYVSSIAMDELTPDAVNTIGKAYGTYMRSMGVQHDNRWAR